ncbi:hypothetical protein MMC18_003202 [Xylographa bjoerkii]|nr:hypothetical protein [Xylographa bjoerkii]
MPPITGVENSGGIQWDLDNNGIPTTTILTPTAAQPLSVSYTNVEYGGAGLWPDSYSGLSTHNPGHKPTDVYQAQRWHDPSCQAPSTSASPYNAWGAGGSVADVKHLNYSPEALVGQAEARQSSRQDFHIPFSISVPSGANETAKGISMISPASKPSGVKTIPLPANQAREKLERVSDQATTGSSASAARTAKKQSSSLSRMPPVTQSIGRRSDDGDSHNGTRRVSRDSVRSDRDKREGETAAVPFRADSDNNEGMRRSILRKNQVDVFEDFSGLPAEKGFPIQIGSELFRLSGASIMSDAPSYFSKFFEDQLRLNDDGTDAVRTLYIDRDPTTFQDIARHLQGYHVQPRDGEHYVRIFADAQFYSLPQLMKQLFDSEIFIQIGDQNFQIPRTLFSSPGDSPNFFSLGFGAFFNSPEEVFPGLDRSGLLRPPSITPPSVQNRSAQTFSELLHLLRGYPLHIRNNDHRAELLRDCRYFHLRGLEQKLIMHHISYNVERQKSEIILRLEDIRQSGISFVGDASPSDRSPLCGWVNYMRPFVDESSHELIVEVGDESLKIDFRSKRGDFYGNAKARITSLFQVVANKMNLPTNVPLGLMLPLGGVAAQPVSPGNTPLSEDKVKVCIERDAHILLDGEEYSLDRSSFDTYDTYTQEGPSSDGGPTISVPSSAGPYSTPLWPPADSSASLQPSRPSSTKPPPRKRKRRGSLDEFGEWIIRKGQWRLRVQPRAEQTDHEEQRMEIVLHAVKLDACDEYRPECKKCTSFGYSCNYDPSIPDLQMSFQGATVINAPQKPWRSINQHPVSTIGVPARLSPAVTSDSNMTFQLDRQSLDRLARFQTRTVFFIGTPSSVSILQNIAIGLAFSQPCLMHAIQATTAVHDRFLYASPYAPLTTTELYHLSEAAALFNRKLSAPVQPSERDALWITAVLLGSITFAQIETSKPEEAWPLAPSNPSDLEWLQISDRKAAVWNLTNPLRPDGVFHVLADEYHNEYLAPAAIKSGIAGIPLVFLQLYGLDTLSTADNNPYFSAVHTIASLLSIEGNQLSATRYLSFISHMKQDFKRLVELKDSRALLLMAYWFAKGIHLTWWIQRRAKTECQATCLYLERYYADETVIQDLLQFPKIECGLMAPVEYVEE